MDHEEIRRLVALMEETGLAELEVERDGARLRLVRAVAGSAAAAPVAAPAAAAAANGGEPAGDGIPPGMRAIESPMVGTFHAAPQPGERPFVLPGDVVRPGQVLCIVEAMKMMNEVVAEVAARVVSIRTSDGAPVEYGSILFLVEPLG